MEGKPRGMLRWFLQCAFNPTDHVPKRRVLRQKEADSQEYEWDGHASLYRGIPYDQIQYEKSPINDAVSINFYWTWGYLSKWIIWLLNISSNQQTFPIWSLPPSSPFNDVKSVAWQTEPPPPFRWPTFGTHRESFAIPNVKNPGWWEPDIRQTLRRWNVSSCVDSIGEQNPTSITWIHSASLTWNLKMDGFPSSVHLLFQWLSLSGEAC